MCTLQLVHVNLYDKMGKVIIIVIPFTRFAQMEVQVRNWVIRKHPIHCKLRVFISIFIGRSFFTLHTHTSALICLSVGEGRDRVKVL